MGRRRTEGWPRRIEQDRNGGAVAEAVRIGVGECRRVRWFGRDVKADLLTGRDRKRAKSQQLGLGRRKNDPLAPRALTSDPGVNYMALPLMGVCLAISLMIASHSGPEDCWYA